MYIFKQLIVIAFALMAVVFSMASAEPGFGSQANVLRPSRPQTLPPNRPVQPDFNKPRGRF